MNTPSPNPDANTHKSLRTQQLVLLGMAFFMFLFGWLDGLSGFIHTIERAHAEQAMIKIVMRWYLTYSLPLGAAVALVLAGIAQYRKQLFSVKTMVICGVVVVNAIIFLSISALFAFDSWIEAQGYERCAALDDVQGVTRHGARNVEISAWVRIGQCR